MTESGQFRFPATWAADPAAAGYDVLRGEVVAGTPFAYDYGCVAQVTSASFADPYDPPTGAVRYYVVSSTNVCGTTGPGLDSAGLPRPAFAGHTQPAEVPVEGQTGVQIAHVQRDMGKHRPHAAETSPDLSPWIGAARRMSMKSPAVHRRFRWRLYDRHQTPTFMPDAERSGPWPPGSTSSSGLSRWRR